jgi:hypothetical protein
MTTEPRGQFWKAGMRNPDRRRDLAGVGIHTSGSYRAASVDQELGESCKLWVDDKGKILELCERIPAMFGFRRDELIGQHISLLLPDLADTELLCADAVNPRLAYRSRCCIPFRAIARNGRVSNYILFMRVVKFRVEHALAIILRRLQVDPMA